MIQFRIDIIENDIDIKIESIVDQLHQMREEFKKDLNEIKENYKR